MAKKKEAKTEKIEREYIIPLRKKVKIVPRYKKTNKAVRTIKEFLVRHMKIRDRDLKKVKIDKYLNEYLWNRGIRHPPIRIKVKAVKEGDVVRAELAESEIPTKIKFKKLREEKITKKAKEIIESKKGLMERAKESFTKPAETKEKAGSEITEPEKTEDKKEEKEREKVGIEATQMLEKEMAKQSKHKEKMHPKEPKHQFRQALEK